MAVAFRHAAAVPDMCRNAGPAWTALSAWSTFAAAWLDPAALCPAPQVVTLQLHNLRGVPCEWAFRKPLDALRCADWEHFSCEPSEGVLAPAEKLKVKVGCWQCTAHYVLRPEQRIVTTTGPGQVCSLCAMPTWEHAGSRGDSALAVGLQ
jgi:hypothetical protein